MDDVNKLEGLMVKVMNLFSETFREHAILKGGMVLRLLDCPRYTNDLDYVFVPFQSKKEVHPKIVQTLKRIEGAKLRYAMHSTSARYFLEVGNFSLQIEVNVMQDCPSQPMSNASLARQENQVGHVISVMSFDHAMAHKMAAWNERGLMRDLYDIVFLFSKLNEMPNMDVLKKRLSKIHYQRSRQGPREISLADFLLKLDNAADHVSQETIEEELRDVLGPEELAGLDKKLRSQLKILIEKLRDGFRY